VKNLKLRYRVFLLVIMMLLPSALAVGISLYEIGQNNHKFCDVIDAALSGPAPKPANPVTDPSRARAYTDYVKFVSLGHTLGCY
jgi:hypothetical protein